jgi:predicted transcriptional regulator
VSGPDISNSHDLRRQEVQLIVLRHVANQPNASTREIASAVGFSSGASVYVLRVLIGKGLVKAENFAQAERKSQYAYLLKPFGALQRSYTP